MLPSRYIAAAFAQHPQLGAVRLRHLDEVIGGEWERLWKENPPGLAPAEREALSQVRKNVDPAALADYLRENRITVITRADKTFPALLREIPDPPIVLFVKGDAALLGHPQLVALVGTRRISPYGKLAVAHLVPPLVHAGCATVSGLAFGVDAEVHRQSLQAGGKTIAVLPCGIGLIYPASHATLAATILVHGGALLSEFPLMLGAQKHHFLIRNRLIAGLCAATVVVEAAQRSGSHLTARAALEANREVFAVPGSIFSPYSVGCHALLKLGAQLATTPADILEGLGIAATIHEQAYTPQAHEELIMASIPREHPIGRDELAQTIKIEPTTLNSVLTTLELKGVIANIGGGRIQRLVDLKNASKRET